MIRKIILGLWVLLFILPGTLRAGTIFRLNESLLVPEGTTIDEAIVLRGSADIAGHVVDNVIVVAGNVNLGPRALIGGDVVCLGGKITSSNDALVIGTKVEIGGQIGWKSLPFISIGKLFLWSFLYKVIVSVIMLGLAAAIVLIWPNQVFITAEEAAGDLVKSSLAGILTLAIGIPLVIGFGVTLFGLPVSAALCIFLLVVHWFGVAAVAYLVGNKILKDLSPPAAVLVGFLLLKIIYFVPFLGGMLYFICVLPGVGSVILTRFGTSKQWPDAAKPKTSRGKNK